MTPRETLAAAIHARDEAIEADELARVAVAGADRLVAEIAATLATFECVGERIAAERAEEMRAAIAAGTRPSFTASAELADAIVQKGEAENQLAAAQQARSTLQAEADAARHRCTQAANAVAAAVNDVIRFEADEIARRVAALEAEARALRAKAVGAEYAPPVGRTKPGEAEAAMLRTNERVTDMAVRNTPDWIAAERYRARWQAFAAELERDPGATLEGIA